MLDQFVEWAHDSMTPEALDILLDRGVSDEQVERFRLGYVEQLPEAVPSLLGHFLRKHEIRQAHVFPLTNVLGDVLGVQFRSIHQHVRGYRTWYVPGTLEPTFFGLGQAAPHIWEKEQILLVEGAFDLFPCHRAVPFTVATQTATVTASFARLLGRLVKTVWVMYDMDAAGSKGLSEAKKAHGELFRVEGLRYPEVFLVDGKSVKDPADLWLAWGDDKLRAFFREKMANG